MSCRIRESQKTSTKKKPSHTVNVTGKEEEEKGNDEREEDDKEEAKAVGYAAIDPNFVTSRWFDIELCGTRLKIVLSDSLSRLQELSIAPGFTGALQGSITLGTHGELSLCLLKVDTF